jgi:hypothetical protein
VSDREQLDALDRLHRLFAAASVEYWLFGGWAVDFHAGAVTRPHADLDMAVWASDLPRIAELLERDGWTHAPEGAEEGSTSYARGAVRLELAFLARDEDGEPYTPLPGGGRATWAEGAFENDMPKLAGVSARVISLRSLTVEKSGPRDDAVAAAKDRADLATLAELD